MEFRVSSHERVVYPMLRWRHPPIKIVGGGGISVWVLLSVEAFRSEMLFNKPTRRQPCGLPGTHPNYGLLRFSAALAPKFHPNVVSG